MFFSLGRVLELLDGEARSSPLLLRRRRHLGLDFRLLGLAGRVDHARRVGEGPGKGSPTEQVVAGGVGEPLPKDQRLDQDCHNP